MIPSTADSLFTQWQASHTGRKQNMVYKQPTLDYRNLLRARHGVLLLLAAVFVHNCAQEDIHLGRWKRASFTSKLKSTLDTSPLELWTEFPKGTTTYRMGCSYPKATILHPYAVGTGYDNETAVVQRLIRENQHPSDCENGKFFVYKLNNFGMGSDIHTLGN